ncbi:mechanosensitive ion channel domain-containing protein [Neptuniibacter halophilus]|uniref:mechanosensitive ion channel domain-containing protein n=1 Tax=Neptuniibacter halophilus TaxID=651666 RepID=UPI0025743D74|nr:mechanosensitive ion channel domain-containing protein [Neptuniibacter halophilus]
MDLSLRWLALAGLVLFWLAGPLKADSAAEIEQYQQQIEQLSASEAAVDISRRQLLQRLVSTLQGEIQQSERIESLQQELDQQPALQSELQDRLLTPLQPEPELEPEISDKALDKLITDINLNLLEIKRRQAQYKQTEGQALQRQQSIREQLSDLKVTGELADRSADPENSELLERLRNARFSEHSLRVQALELELLVLPRRTEIAKMQWQIAEQERLRQVARLDQLVVLKQERQRQQAEKTLKDLEYGSEEGSASPLLVMERDKNRLLSAALRTVLQAIDSREQERKALQERLTLLNSAFSVISQQLELETSQITPDQIQFMFANRTPLETGQTINRIARLQLDGNQLEQQSSELSQRLNDAEPLPGVELSAAQERVLLEIRTNRLRLLNQSVEAHQQLVDTLSQVLSLQRQINQKIEGSRELISRHLLWNPVTGPVSGKWLQEIAVSVKQLHGHWLKSLSEPLLIMGERFNIQVILAGLLCAGLLWLRAYTNRHQQRWAQQIGNVVDDRFHHSLQSFLLMPILAAAVPLFVWVVGINLINPGHPEAEIWTSMLQATVTLTWIILTLRAWLKRPYGLFMAHFGLNPVLAGGFRKRLAWVYPLALPAILLQLYCWNIDTDEMRSGLVRLTQVGLLLWVGLVLFSVLRLQPAGDDQEQDMPVWWMRVEHWTLGILFFGLLMLVLNVMGYLFTANFLIFALAQLLTVFLLTYIFFKLGMRLVLISKRRLEFDRVRERRAEMLEQRKNPDEDQPPPLETNFLNLKTISDHSKTLLKTSAVLVFVSLLWLTMADYFTFFGALDNVELWSTVSADGSAAAVTLKSVLFGVVILSLCLLAAYNLPGLLQLLVLRNLELAPGTGYAISSLIKYVLILVGVLGAFSSFGLEWGKLQWLVAALGVGLGFGLQEIVANFVSGLIILFEKPVRIGDTVTIDGLTGTVTRIQIRATTIIDWDRKEVIIPNKTFITQQLINWSLTDSTTRIVIPVGVAYGSDTELARGLMLEAAAEEERVLQDPKPEAFFTGFGDSTLNLELRLFVSAMADRLEMTHRVNTSIDRKFKQAGLEIAFPQLDVHIKRN